MHLKHIDFIVGGVCTGFGLYAGLLIGSDIERVRPVPQRVDALPRAVEPVKSRREEALEEELTSAKMWLDHYREEMLALKSQAIERDRGRRIGPDDVRELPALPGLHPLASQPAAGVPALLPDPFDVPPKRMPKYLPDVTEDEKR